jgi:hypothetical protein
MRLNEAVTIVRKQLVPMLAKTGGGGYVDAISEVLTRLTEAEAESSSYRARIVQAEQRAERAEKALRALLGIPTVRHMLESHAGKDCGCSVCEVALILGRQPAHVVGNRQCLTCGTQDDGGVPTPDGRP